MMTERNSTLDVPTTPSADSARLGVVLAQLPAERRLPITVPLTIDLATGRL
jgi:hypothetical protein